MHDETAAGHCPAVFVPGSMIYITASVDRLKPHSYRPGNWHEENRAAVLGRERVVVKPKWGDTHGGALDSAAPRAILSSSGRQCANRRERGIYARNDGVFGRSPRLEIMKVEETRK